MTRRLLHFCLFAFLSMHANSLGAQTGLRLSYLKFTGDSDSALYPTPSAELYIDRLTDNEHFRFGASIGFMSCQARKDTFFSKGYQYTDGQLTTLNSYTIIHRFNVITIGFNAEYLILKKKLKPLIGLDLYLNISDHDIESYLESVISSREESSGVSMGFLPRVGARYDPTDRLSVSAGVGYCGALFAREIDPLKYWKIYASISYVLFD